MRKFLAIALCAYGSFSFIESLLFPYKNSSVVTKASYKKLYEDEQRRLKTVDTTATKCFNKIKRRGDLFSWIKWVEYVDDKRFGLQENHEYSLIIKTPNGKNLEIWKNCSLLENLIIGERYCNKKEKWWSFETEYVGRTLISPPKIHIYYGASMSVVTKREKGIDLLHFFTTEPHSGLERC